MISIENIHMLKFINHKDNHKDMILVGTIIYMTSMQNIHKLTFLYLLSDMNLYFLALKLSFNSKN